MGVSTGYVVRPPSETGSVDRRELLPICVRGRTPAGQDQSECGRDLAEREVRVGGPHKPLQLIVVTAAPPGGVPGVCF